MCSRARRRICSTSVTKPVAIVSTPPPGTRKNLQVPCPSCATAGVRSVVEAVGEVHGHPALDVLLGHVRLRPQAHVAEAPFLDVHEVVGAREEGAATHAVL